jgi:TPR repeat protein
MNQQDAQTVPNYVTCPCQYCSGKIEFDANQLDAENPTVLCPHCGLETIIFIPQSQGVPPVISDKELLNKTSEQQKTPLPFPFEPSSSEDAGRIWLLWKAAKAGHAESQATLGFAFYEGSYVPKDYNEAFKWIKKAAEQGHAHAQSNLGICYVNGQGVAKDEAEGIKWLVKAAEHGNAHAEYSLGGVYYLGQGVSKDFQEALKWWHRAAEHGNAEAQNNLGVLYGKGDGVPQDYVEAYKWIKLAAAQGDDKAKEYQDTLTSKMSKEQIAEGQKRIEEFSQSKKEPVETSDDDNFVTVVQKLAEDGDLEAQFLFACFLAELGNSFGQFQLGMAYFNGDGTAKNDAEAVKWWRKSADQGNVQAQAMLGLAYLHGNGVPQDYFEATTWLFKAAQMREPNAQLWLAICYFQGNGVPQSYVDAYKWANLAATSGLKEAKEFRDNLSAKLSSQQIAQGQRLAVEEMARKLSSVDNERVADQMRQAIPADVRREVWRRDEGKCVKCGSRKNLEYDHIIPVSRGGSNTARNIELLCETCNRSKSASIQ